jgi:WD40-like Beta Propeller Repeat
MRTGLKAAIGAMCALALAPAAANADSIVYVKDKNVWIANPDGSGQHQVTKSGEEYRRWHAPTQADDGTIVAAHGEEIVRLKQNGTELSRFDPPAADTSYGPFDGVPTNLAVSPDGSKVAYTFSAFTCPPGAPCGAKFITVYSRSDRPEPFGRLYGRRGPEWVTNDRIVVFGGYGSQVNFDDADDGADDSVHWFDDPSEDASDGAITRQGDRLVYVRSYGSNTHLQFVNLAGDARTSIPPAPDPSAGCQSGTDETIDEPTWSPDGEKLAVAHSQGIEVLPLGRASCQASGTVVIPGGSEPDWGPADVNPGRPETEVPHQPNPCGRGFCQPPKEPAQPPKLSAAKSKLRVALSRGVTVNVRTNGTGKVKVELLNGRKAVAKGSASVDGSHAAKVKAKFTRAAKKALARKRSVKLTVRVTWTPASGEAAQQSTARLTLKR